MTTIVVRSPFRIAAKDLAATLPGDTLVDADDDGFLARAAEVEVAFTGHDRETARSILAAAPRLRWYHTAAAGVERFPLSEFRDRGIVFTNNSGSYDAPIAEHVMAFLFAAARRLHRYRDQQARREWKPLRQANELRDSTLVVFGLGSIGGEVARLASAVGMRVIGVRRSGGAAPGATRVVPPEALAEVAAEADYLVVAAPHTPATRGAVSRAVIARLKPTAWIVNIARGALIDEEALVEALREGRIGGAGLDVFEREPLPADSPLWAFENVIVTPHSSNSSPHLRERTLALFVENLRRYKAGEPLLSRVDLEAGY